MSETFRLRTAWGTYIPGRRIEMHQDHQGLGGWWYLVQYEPQSPHPESWRSRYYLTIEAARDDALRTRILEEESGEKLLALSNVVHLAFFRHLELKHNGALRDLTCDCLNTTVEVIDAAAHELEILKEMS